MCAEMGLKLLAQVPHDPRLAGALDSGADFLEKHPDSPAAQAFVQLGRDVAKICADLVVT